MLCFSDLLRRPFMLALPLLPLLPLTGCSLVGGDDEDAFYGAFEIESLYRSPTKLMNVFSSYGAYTPSNFIPAVEQMADDPRNRLVLIPLDGSGEVRYVGEPGDYDYTRISEDGRFVLAAVQEPFDADALLCPNGLWDILVHDVEAGTTRVIGRPRHGEIVQFITPDGRYVFASDCTLRDELRGSHVYDLSEDEPEAQQPWAERLEARMLMPDGQQVLSLSGVDPATSQLWERWSLLSVGNWTQAAFSVLPVPSEQLVGFFFRGFTAQSELIINGGGTEDPSTLFANPPVFTGEGSFLWDYYGDGSLRRVTDSEDLQVVTVSPDERFAIVDEYNEVGFAGRGLERQWIYRLGTEERYEVPGELRARHFTPDGRIVLLPLERTDEILTATPPAR